MSDKSVPLAEAAKPQDEPKRPRVIINDGENRYLLASSAIPYMDYLEGQNEELRERGSGWQNRAEELEGRVRELEATIVRVGEAGKRAIQKAANHE